MKLTFFYVLSSIALSALVLLLVSPVSCTLSKDGLKLITCDAVPEIISFSVEDSRKLNFVFDKEVNITDLQICETQHPDNIIPADNTDSFECNKNITLLQPMRAGTMYTAKGIVEDNNCNSLLFSIEFKGFNDNLAEIYIAEIRNAYSSKTNQYEYVKFLCTKSGNLSGYEFFTAGDGEQKKYVFPDIGIEKGDFVTVHLRKMKDSEGNYMQKGMVDELNGDKNQSFAVDSSDSSWDFWVDNQKSRISPADIIVLRNMTDGSLVDVVLLSDGKQGSEWSKKYSSICNLVEESGLWLDSNDNATCDIQSAVSCNGISSSSVNKIITRRNFTVPTCASDWFIKSNTPRKKSKSK